MKKLVLLLCTAFIYLSSTTDARSSHFAGGEIWYEYVGNAQFPNRYDVYLIVYRDVSGASMNFYIPAPICIKSSCWGTMTVNAPLLPFTLKPGSDTLPGSITGSILTPELTDCINPNSPGLVVTEAYRFYTQVDLPSGCPDVTFAYSANARNTSDNLTTAGNLYLEAKLNTTLGHNTSPKFLNPAAKSFCVGTPFIWSQAAIEPDGDSLFYDFGIPQTGGCTNPTYMTFRPGYSKSAPMTTTTGITFNNKTGTLRFTAAQPEVVVINITVTEYRFNSAIGQYLVIGSSVRDLQIPVVSGCKVGSTYGPQIASSSYPQQQVSTDSIKGYGFSKISNYDSIPDPNNPGQFLVNIPVIDYNCFDNVVNLKFDDGVYCETIAPDGSDFRIVGPDSIARPVTGVIDHCRPDLVTKNIDLLLHKPLDVNGDYFLQIKTGNDGNTLTNKCGFPLDPFFMVIIRVSNCPTPDYSLENVSVNLDREIDIDWEIDINSFEPSIFTAWNILRANSNGQFYVLQSLDKPGDVNLRSYKDTSVTAEDVDLTQFQYMVQLVQNGTAFPPSNIIHSILLESTEKVTKEGVDYSWSTYDGWANPSYEFEYGRFNTATNQMDWANYNGPTPAYQNDEYFYPSCEENKDTTGLYGFRVLATNPATPAGGFVSESNWLYYEITCPQDPGRGELTAIVPSVFTPNGDGNNDLFKLTTNFENADVAIYNRWGKLVFESSGNPEIIVWDGSDKESGKMVADGVYYYVVGLSGQIDDGQGGKERITDDLTGSVTIFSNGTK